METTKYDGNKTVNWSEVGWQPKEIKAPGVGKLKLSEAIRRGKPLVGEEKIDFKLCAMGCAWAGVKGRKASYQDPEFVKVIDGSYPNFAEAMGKHLGFDEAICRQVSRKHCGGMPALQIADWLESQGF